MWHNCEIRSGYSRGQIQKRATVRGQNRPRMCEVGSKRVLDGWIKFHKQDVLGWYYSPDHLISTPTNAHT